jgi:hypothetical protein
MKGEYHTDAVETMDLNLMYRGQTTILPTTSTRPEMPKRWQHNFYARFWPMENFLSPITNPRESLRFGHEKTCPSAPR